MSSEICQGVTKKGTPCKNKAVENGFCRVHAKAAKVDIPTNNVTPISAALDSAEIDSAEIDSAAIDKPIEKPEPQAAAETEAAQATPVIETYVAENMLSSAIPVTPDTTDTPVVDTGAAADKTTAEAVSTESLEASPAADTAETLQPQAAAAATDSAPEPKPTTKTFDMIVNTGASLVDGLSKAIQHTPGVMDKLFTYSGAKKAMPERSERLQQSATETTLKRLEKFQYDLIAMGADQQKLDQLLEKTQQLEDMVERTLHNSGKLIPENVRMELKKSLERIKSLKK